nr:phage virion morphogenesis protein [Cupriavidus gilardii]
MGWAGLGWAPATRKRRDGGEILQDSGRLASSVVARAEADAAVVATNIRYAAIHQFGGEITRAAHSGWVRLRTDASGKLIRQGKNGRLAVFAKASHKRARTGPVHDQWQQDQDPGSAIPALDTDRRARD